MGFNFSVTAPSKTFLLPQCGLCGLYKVCKSPKMKPFGEGQRGILIVGEGPGETEDREGKPFIGKSGQLLRSTLGHSGVDVDRDCWTTNSIICRATTRDGKNRPPTPMEIEYCRPNLIKTINELNPKVIILLGGSAVKSLIEWVWKDKVGKVSRWDGWRIPCQKINAWICPTWHPAYILRTDYGSSQRENDVRKLFFERHLRAACKIKKRPWKKVPDWKRDVQAIFSPEEAAGEINKLTSFSGTEIAIDFETDRLKPDHPDSRIVCCGISNGKKTIAYPWHGRAIKATEELLFSDVPKIGWNIKFEERWAIKEFGRPINNWLWDGMLASHILDNRPEISGLKFQAFVQLGMASYDDEIKLFLKSGNSNTPNRIKEVDLNKLLLYNGLDALLEFKIAKRQMSVHDHESYHS